MKFAVISSLLGTLTATEIDKEEQDSFIQEAQKLENICKDWQEYDEESLLEVDADKEDTNLQRHTKHVKSSYKRHYGKTKHQIDKENRHILTTQRKCLNFVKRYRGHMKVCNWCKRAPTPRIRWRWVATENVWYRWYSGKWHYWGPSKRGFTVAGWTWYKGYWHHRGYVFTFWRRFWYRFQGGKWVKYGRKVPIKPKAPRGPRICRPFYILKKWGFPVSLSVRKLPRCKVGSGRKASYYMWRNARGCRFLGGRLVYQRHKTCKSGRPHQWKRVVRCVKGPVLSKRGLNYRTGRAFRKAKSTRSFSIGGLRIGSCYKFRAQTNTKYFMGDDRGYVESSPKYKQKRVWKVKRGLAGKRNSITLASAFKKGYAIRHQGYRAKIHKGRSKLFKLDASFWITKGLGGGRRNVSFRSVNFPKYFLSYIKKRGDHPIYIRKYNRSRTWKKRATWVPYRTRCPKAK